ncbi:MAG: co-chaperone GroES [Candidatus Omnitrophica bacterium]|nr:co-chaperone GroES [Candidatus Omnitrophota bacterium]
MKINLLEDRVLIEQSKGLEKTKGGIVLPDSAQEKPQEGKIVAVGEGKKNDDGKLVALTVKVGDKVLYGKYSGTALKVDDEEYIMVRESDVVAILG